MGREYVKRATINNMTNLLTNLEMAEYQQQPGLSKHQLDAFAIAPAYYKWKLTQSFTPSKSMQLGTLVHSLALENREDFAVAPECDRRTKEGKLIWQNFCEENLGKIVINAEEEATVRGACASVAPFLSQLKIDHVEASMFWKRDGIQCKGRPDIIGSLNGQDVILDLKTVTGISNFDSSFWRLRYDVQAQWYQHGAAEAIGKHYRFLFLVVDMEQPHLAQFVYPSSEVLADACEKIEGELLRYKICQERNQWDGLPSMRVILPR